MGKDRNKPPEYTQETVHSKTKLAVKNGKSFRQRQNAAGKPENMNKKREPTMSGSLLVFE